MAQLLGGDAKFLLMAAALSAVVGSSVTGTEVKNIIDLDLNMEVEKTDTTTRETAATGWGTEETTLKKATVSFEMMWKPADTAFTNIRNAFINNTEIGAAALDQAPTVIGAQGLVSNFKVSKFAKSEKLKEGQKVSIELSVSSFPSWFVKGA